MSKQRINQYDLLTLPPRIGDEIKIREVSGGTDGTICEVSYSGKSFRLKGLCGNESPKWYHIRDLIHSDNKTVSINREHRDINGYRWIGHENGIHTFSKQIGKKYATIECTEEQLYDGDIEFMTLNEWTLSKERKREYIKKYKLRL